MPPITTSDVKCWRAVTRVSETVVARPYAPNFVRGPGYSCAITPAIDHAIALCSDGKDILVPECCPEKKSPSALETYGRWREVATLKAYVTAVALIAASADRNPVSRMCSLLVSLPKMNAAPPAPMSE